ncbi:MAG: thioredoxin family protein [Chitinophagaceae bacterium]|nr:thioredoxin family protein [Chitinophagaceae bacterium]
MKLIISFFIVAVFTIRSQAQAPLTSDEVLKQAYELAAKENKKVFVIFHASWCGWCRKMDTAMNDASVKKFFDDNFIIRHLTVYESPDKKNLENPGALDLLIKYKGDDQGIPYWFVFDANGNLLADSQITAGVNSGCPATKEEVDHFINVLRKTTSLTANQLASIENRFLQNSH